MWSSLQTQHICRGRKGHTNRLHQRWRRTPVRKRCTRHRHCLPCLVCNGCSQYSLLGPRFQTAFPPRTYNKRQRRLSFAHILSRKVCIAPCCLNSGQDRRLCKWYLRAWSPPHQAGLLCQYRNWCARSKSHSQLKERRFRLSKHHKQPVPPDSGSCLGRISRNQ